MESKENKLRNKGKKLNNKSERACVDSVQRFNPIVEQGLNENQIAVRQNQKLVNFVKEKNGKGYLSIFVDNICTFFNLLGFIIIVIMISLGSWGNLFFSVVIIANTSIGIIQEIRAKRSVERLSLMNASTVKAVRCGNIENIMPKDVVLDDVLILESGMQICADGEVLDGEIEVDESLLTGESISVKKHKGDKVFAGTYVVSGMAKMYVEKVGIDNYVEQLAQKAKKYKKPNSELINSIKKLVRIIAIVIVPLGVGTFLVSWLVEDVALTTSIINASGSVLGMVPAGIVLLTSVALSIAVIRLAKQHTLVKDLYCIEMLARVNVLCLDKTGTITDGTMTVKEVQDLQSNSKFSVDELMREFCLATDSKNQTANAMYDKFVGEKDLKGSFQVNGVIAFSSQRKLSAISFDNVGTVVMGAPEFVFKNLSDEIAKTIDSAYSSGMRVIIAGYSEKMIENDCLPDDIKPCALFVLEDTVRDDAVKIIKWFKDNDVEVKIISGDNPKSVAVIAEKVGVVQAERYINLYGLSDEEVKKAANEYTVFGRVTPEQKAILVSEIKSNKNTVAMTGDGVNDILALKEADCAIVMASGSDAARAVAHIILMDNKFSSMPNVVVEGRRVVNNIQCSSSIFLMKTLFSILFAVALIIMQKAYPFAPMHMYVLEFFVIGVPAFFLALQTNNELIKGKFLTNTLKKAVPFGILMFLGVVGLYILNAFIPMTSQQLLTVAMIVMTFIGCICLVFLCYPFTLMGIIVCVCSVFASILPFVLIPGFFKLAVMTDPMKIYIAIALSVTALILLIVEIFVDKFDVVGKITGRIRKKKSDLKSESVVDEVTINEKL